MTPGQRERLVTCIHEASHACAHFAYYQDIRSIALDSGGHAGLTTASIRRRSNDPVKLAICCLAGPAGEYLFTGRRLSRSNVGQDLDNAANHLRGTGVCVRDLWPKALALVRRYEPEIRTVAQELFWRGRLNGVDIECLIGGGFEPASFA
jgi:hypothetical protein